MKKVLFTLVLAAANLVEAQTFYTYDYIWNPAEAIPDGNPVGVTHDFTVSGATEGSIYDVQVSLDITGGFNGDLYAYLVSPQGWTAILLNRVGVTSGNSIGYGDTGFDTTLDGLTGNDAHFYQNYPYSLDGNGRLTGNWAADGRDIAPNSAPSAFDSASTAANLGQYAGYDANGTWTLFIADLSGGGSATLNQAILTIITVPEPQTWLMLGGGLTALVIILRRRRQT